MHAWQITAWLNRERLSLEQGADAFGVAVATFCKWRDTCHAFSPQQAEAIARVMVTVPEMPAAQPVLWSNPYPNKGQPGVLSPEEVKARRQRLGLTLRQLADHMRLSHVYLYDIEHGRRRCTERVANVLATLERKHA